MESKPKEKSDLARSAGIVSMATLISRLLGLVREQVTAYLFGASDAVDAFKSAFRIPNLLRDMFAEGALSAGFIPIFSEKLRSGSREDAIRFAGLVFGALTAIVAVVVLLMMMLTPQLVSLIAEGFEQVPGKLDSTVSLARLMMPFLLMVSLAALLMGILNSLGKFFIPALAPALMNIGMILCAIALTPFVDPPVLSLAIGVLVGGAAQFLVQYLALRKAGFRFPLIVDFANPDLLRLILLILPTAVGLAATQINVAVVNRIASTDSGAVSYLDYAFRLLHLPLGLFAIAIATVALPRLSAEAASGNVQQFGQIHSSALRLGLFLSLPATMLMVLLAEPICAAVYQYGAFTSENSLQTAKALAMYSVGLPFFTLVRITVPAFYAMKDTKTPAIISLMSVLANVLMCFELRDYFGFSGLALAASLAGIVNFGLLTYLLRKRIKIAEDAGVLMAFARIGGATLLTGAVVWLVREYVVAQFIADRVHHIFELLIQVAIAIITLILSCWLFRVEELTQLKNAIKGRFLRSR
ncbi:MAG: murein biosynthesis integral membrane protein MurJ [Candidatus Zixiibacteriota bacterium]